MIYITMLAITPCAAFVAYLGNRSLFRAIGRKAAVVAVPWWEEGCKAAVIALLPGHPILPVHALFGSLELLYDVARGRAEGLYLGLLSLTGHGLVGAVSVQTAEYGGSLWWGYLGAVSTHMVVNLFVVNWLLPFLRGRAATSLGQR